MVRIQLETGYLDVKEGSSFPLNFSVGDIRDLSKRNGTFSKTITLIGSKNNHQLLNHYYDVNIQAGTFNINTITRCSIIENDIPIIEDALMQLVNVRKSQVTDAYEQMVEYDVLVKDTQAEFYTAITNKELTDLDFTDLNHTFDSTTIYNSFVHTVADGYKYLLPYKNIPEYSVNELKPAIYAQLYLDRIFSTAGFTYEWTGLTAAHFDKLLIPYNGDVNNFDYNDYLVEATNTWTTSYVQPSEFNFSFDEVITGWTEVTDLQSLFDPITAEYTTPFYSNAGAGQFYEYKLAIAGSIILDNTYSQTMKLVPLIFGSGYNRYRVRVRVNVAGYDHGYIYGTPITVAYTTGSPLAIGQTTILGFSEVLDFGAFFNTAVGPPGINASDIQIMDVGVEVVSCLDALGTSVTPFGYLNSFLGTTSGTGIVNVILDLSSINLKITPSANIQVAGGIQDMNTFIPLKIKQSDFVKSIFQMYNLYIEIDEDQPNNLIFRHRDEFYDNGAEKDWTYKLMKEKEQNLLFLPDVTNKKLKLTYKADTDSANQVYTQMTNEIYGQLEYTFDNEYVKGTDTKELIFSPTPVTVTPFGAYVPMMSGQAPKNNIRILYDGGQQSCSQWNLIDYGSVGFYGIQEYPMLGHFDNALTPTFDINFAVNDFYFYPVPTLTANNLYNTYWRRTVNQINVGKMLTAYFDLNESDIQTLKLNDKIRIDNSWWNINKIMDYDANSYQPTKVELISVDSEIDFAPFQEAIGTPTPSTTTSLALDYALSTNAATNNVVMAGGDVTIHGEGNSATPGVRGMIIGNHNILTEDGIITPRINGVIVPIVTTYIANMTQASTNDPTAYILENSIGTITWTRTSAGQYIGVGDAPFDLNLTSVIVNNTDFNLIYSARVNGIGQILISTYDLATTTLVDTALNNTTISIRQYE